MKNKSRKKLIVEVINPPSKKQSKNKIAEINEYFKEFYKCKENKNEGNI